MQSIVIVDTFAPLNVQIKVGLYMVGTLTQQQSVQGFCSSENKHMPTCLCVDGNEGNRTSDVCHFCQRVTKRTERTAHALSNPWKSPGQFSRRAARSEPVHAKNASFSNGSDSRVKMLTDSDFLMSLWVGCGLARRGGTSPSSSSAIEAARPRGVDMLVKSSSNIERGDIESESNRNRVAGESASPRARVLLADRGEAVASSGSNANL